MPGATRQQTPLNDTFLDLPLLPRLAIYQKFTLGNEQSVGCSSKIGLRYLDVGSQMVTDRF